MMHREAVWKLVENYKAGRLSRARLSAQCRGDGILRHRDCGSPHRDDPLRRCRLWRRTSEEVPREKTVVASPLGHRRQVRRGQLGTRSSPPPTISSAPTCLRAAGVLQRLRRQDHPVAGRELRVLPRLHDADRQDPAERHLERWRRRSPPRMSPTPSTSWSKSARR